MNKKIGFIGVGNMATAILNGMLSCSYVDAQDVCLFDLDEHKCQVFTDKGAVLCSDVFELTRNSDIIVLAVKPQNYADVLTDISTIDCGSKVFVSIAAGISIGYIRDVLKQNVKAVRVMPNTPLLLSKGASALCPSDNLTDDVFEIVKTMFSLSGVVEVIEESHMNEIISVNGSSPAYIYLFTKAIVDYAVSCGIDYNKALNLICATLEGSAAMMRSSGDDLDTLIKKVSSPGGTTIQALNSFEENNFIGIMNEAMTACTNRAEELGK